jgi:hypothetical protein
MTTRRIESRNNVVKLTAFAGVTCRIGQTRGGHQVAVITFKGRVQRVFFSATPSDWRALKNTRSEVRRALRNLGVFSAANQNDSEQR